MTHPPEVYIFMISAAEFFYRTYAVRRTWAGSHGVAAPSQCPPRLRRWRRAVGSRGGAGWPAHTPGTWTCSRSTPGPPSGPETVTHQEHGRAFAGNTLMPTWVTWCCLHRNMVTLTRGIILVILTRTAWCCLHGEHGVPPPRGTWCSGGLVLPTQ
jgi:hypothetical protein